MSTETVETTGPSTAEIRTWARDNGHAVGQRGSLPAAVKDAYAEAHSA